MAGAKPAKNGIELAIQRVILGSRWLQAPLYLGLVAVLAIVVAKFPFKVWELVMRALNGEEADIVLGVLSLVDLILIANLVVMVIISGYENLVSHVDTEGITDKLSWFGKLDAGSIKTKLASSIVAISSIRPAAALPRSQHRRQRQAHGADGHASHLRGLGAAAHLYRPNGRRQEGRLVASSPGGAAALTIWVDIDPADDSTFNTGTAASMCRSGWPVPAGCAAAASRASSRPGRYLPLLRCRDVQALESDAYYGRLRNPSEMSRAVFPKFRDTWRTICTVEQRWATASARRSSPCA